MSFFETALQGRMFLLLLYAGAAAALSYDLLSLSRRRAPPFLRVLLDGLWCLLAGGICLFALILGGEEKLRLYALLGMLCGAGIYCLGIRSVCLTVCRMLKKKRA